MRRRGGLIVTTERVGTNPTLSGFSLFYLASLYRALAFAAL